MCHFFKKSSVTGASRSFALACIAFLFCAPSRAQDIPGIQAKAFLLVDASTGEVLYQRNAHQAYPPASTVKLMTALLIWERTGLVGTIRVASEDTRVEPSHIPLRVGEIVSIREMTNALLIGSDNDSAMVLARAVGGSHGSFISMMNAKAKALGCRNTVFKNPHGLPAPGQVTTASDLMKIFQKVLSIAELRRICTMKTFRLSTQIGTQNIRNHNKLLGVYAGMGPAKTGWTHSSRHTYAASAFRNGRELHLIILNSPNKWVDARTIFDRGFETPSRKSPLPPDVILAGNPPAQPASVKVAPAPVIETVASAPFPARLIPVQAASSSALHVLGAPAENRAAVTTHKVRKGETLFSIGKNYGINVPQLLRYNSLSNPDQIQPGLVLFIPSVPTS
jgi:D-alanyl-D-alanine carboxypeptidase